MSKVNWLQICIFLTLLTYTNALINNPYHYLYLAHAFINGSLSYKKLPPDLIDLSYYNGKYFWPLGPLPAILFLLLLPFTAIFKSGIYDWFIKIPIVIIDFFLVYKISINLKTATDKAWSLATFFVFGSVVTPLLAISYSSYLSQVVGITCLLLGIYEFVSKRRWLLIGTFIALAALSRFEIVLASIFFVLYLVKKPFSLKNVLNFSLPIVTAVIILAIYNYQRFGNFLETGQNLIINLPEEKIQKSYGTFSSKHIPANIYYMLIKTPDPILKNDSHVLKFPYIKPDYWGMSIFFLSPVLFLIFEADYKKESSRNAAITIFVMALPMIMFYGIGFQQIGYRYAAVFYPFILVILSTAIKNTAPIILKILVWSGVLITWLFILEYSFGLF